MTLEIDPGDFENPHGVSAWSADGGAVTQSSAQAHAGTYSAALTVSGTPVQAYIRAYGASAVPVTPGEVYETRLWVRSAAEMTVLAAIDWFDGGGNYLSGVYPDAVTLTVDTWTELVASDVAPPGAALAVYGPTATSPSNAQVLYADDITFSIPTVAHSVTITEQDSWPPRVQIAVTDLTEGDQVEVFRSVAAELTRVRGGLVEEADDPSLVIIDAELPFGVPVAYAVFVNGVGSTTTPVTYTLPGGQVAITDAITGQAAEVKIGGAGDKVSQRTSARFRVAGRNLVVSGPMGQPEGTYELLCMNITAYESLMTMLRTATQGIVQIRQPGTSTSTGEDYDDVDAYLAVDQVTVRRFSQDGSDGRRLVVISYAETDGWAGELLASGFTLQDVADFMDPGATLQDLADLYPAGVLLQIALADWTP